MASIEKRQAQDGSVSYRVKVRLKGKPAQSASFARLTDAKKWAASIESAIREGRHFTKAEAKRRTLAELVARYTRDVLPGKRDGAKRAAQLDWWAGELGPYLLADITPARIAEARDKLAGRQSSRGPIGPATVVRYLAALSHCFTVSTKEYGWTDSNPVQKITKPREPRGRVRFLSDDERTRLLEACRTSKSPLLYPYVVLALATGMRASEISSLYWRMPETPPEGGAWGVLDLPARKVTLHATKNGSRRVLPLAGHALEVVQSLAKVRRIGSNLVFPSPVTPSKPAKLRGHWEDAVKRAGLSDFRLHDCRHDCASQLAMSGASMPEIAAVLGHRSMAMVARYAHLSESHVSGVLEAMNRRMFAGVEGGQ